MNFAPLPATVPPHACETVSGRYVDVVNPRVEDIDINDIAWSLSRQVRYAGHTLGDPYHIAQHACFVEFLLDYVLGEDSNGDPIKGSFSEWMMNGGFGMMGGFRPFQDNTTLLLHALVHDNTEAYLVDLPSPVKRHPALREPYKALEANLHHIICQALDIRLATPEEEHAVLWADLMALQIEAANLMPSRGRGWASAQFPHFELKFMSFMPDVLPWDRARDEYLKKYWELRANTGIS